MGQPAPLRNNPHGQGPWPDARIEDWAHTANCLPPLAEQRDFHRSHQNDHQEISGIHYCTLAAMVEGSGEKNNAFARLDCLPGEAIQIAGFVRQASYDWK